MILERVVAIAVIGLTFLLVANFPPERKSWVGEWAFPAIGFFGWLALILTFGVIGASLASWATTGGQLHVGAVGLQLISAIGFVAGVYVAAITTQVIANLARTVRGERLRPIEWVRHWPRRVRKSNVSRD